MDDFVKIPIEEYLELKEALEVLKILRKSIIHIPYPLGKNEMEFSMIAIHKLPDYQIIKDWYFKKEESNEINNR